ncbi:Polyadenylate-binding protein/Hyperplastic disc protein [Corchorus capsularis]|uniref:Polyadenylate-binding protein/Hyperplastic disc protein n=1 Tax=Corchorus capsularis TaxID=210143 RepID=A0A1R3GAX8_COCAP|nr:Polyadenylate-binding protein/Hyperplastic disc protein [Corchorus capsularis]
MEIMMIIWRIYVTLGELQNSHRAASKEPLLQSLYSLVQRLERDAATPEALKAKVAEAMEVLRTVAAQQQANNPVDQLASLSLTHNLVS